MGRHAVENDDLADFNSIAATTSVRDIADYVAELSAQLAYMAAANKFTILAGLLQLASDEARQTLASLESRSENSRKDLDIPIGLLADFKIGER